MQLLKGKSVFITGASAGIGKACAEQFAASGANLIICARRIERIKSLASTLENSYGIKVLPIQLDVSKKNEINAVIDHLPEEWKNIDILLNNAGAGVTTDLIQNANPDDWDTIIDTNLKGLLNTTRAILPAMVANNKGHIINIGSTAGQDYYRGGNVYSASKHAVKAITRSLRIDLKGYKIRISEIDPGAVKTEFSEVRWDKERSDKLYKGFTPLVADDIADAVIYLATRPEHVNVSEMIIYPVDQVAADMIHREGDKTEGLFDDK